MLICPNCGSPLTPMDGTLGCRQGHRFDLAASGYCNLLLGKKAGELTGDNREMVAARRQFLDSGAYAPLREALCRLTLSLAPDPVRLLDAGCGEGYYTRAVTEALVSSGRTVEALGADISKAAANYAAKRDKRTRYITASSYRLPVSDHCADLILSLFAPAPPEEFTRVLAPGGRVILAVPGTEHLWELKAAIYDEPYENREDKHALPGFRQTGREKLTYPVHLNGPDLIRALFSMTPYIHRTGKESMDRLRALREIDLTLSFLLLTFEKEA